MKTLEIEININKSKDQVWDLLFNRFGEVNLFNPVIEGSHDLGGVKGEVGCERQCDLNAKGTKFIRERIAAVRDNNSFDIEIFDGGLPMMNEMFATVNVIELTPTSTKAHFVLKYSSSPGFMAGMMKGPMSKKLMGMLIGLKYHLETGGLVTKQNIKMIVKEYNDLAQNDSFLVKKAA